ncbi:MAG: hypothetical protein ABFS42_12545 [Candidatus Krumholzibacteriota bacterium]
MCRFFRLILVVIIVFFASSAAAERKNPDLPYGGFAVDLEFGRSLTTGPYLSEIPDLELGATTANDIAYWGHVPKSEITTLANAKVLVGLSSRFTLKFGINSIWTDVESLHYYHPHQGESTSRIKTELSKAIIGEIGLRIYFGGSED